MPTSLKTPERYVDQADIESSARSVLQIFKFNAVLECQTMLAKMGGDPAGTQNWRRILNNPRVGDDAGSQSPCGGRRRLAQRVATVLSLRPRVAAPIVLSETSYRAARLGVRACAYLPPLFPGELRRRVLVAHDPLPNHRKCATTGTKLSRRLNCGRSSTQLVLEVPCGEQMWREINDALQNVRRDLPKTSEGPEGSSIYRPDENRN